MIKKFLILKFDSLSFIKSKNSTTNIINTIAPITPVVAE